MNIVYLMTFRSRVENQTPPYYYVGLKTNCTFENGIIVKENGKPYWSSSESSKFRKCLKIEFPVIEILFESNSQSEVCEKERAILCDADARHNPDFFNMTNGTIDSNSHSSDYATYRHKDTLDCYKRLRRDDPYVLSGEYVGTTNGLKRKGKVARLFGTDNGFYGKSHTDETKKFLSDLAKQRPYNPSRIQGMINSRRGVPTSPLQKKTVSERTKGRFVLKDPVTDKCEQVLKNSEREAELRGMGWMTPNKLKCLRDKESQNRF